MPKWRSPAGKIKVMNLLPWLWLAAAYGITMGYLVLNGRPYVDSDMASEMVLADLLNQEGGLLSHSWGYSTELRIFYLQLLYRPALLLFPHNWYAARMLGQAGWMLVLILCVLFAGKGLGLQGGGVWAAAAMACPFGLWYFWYGAFGGFYVPHMVLLLLSFGLAVRLAEPKTGKAGTALWAILLVLVSFVNGLGSLWPSTCPWPRQRCCWCVCSCTKRRSSCPGRGCAIWPQPRPHW